MLSHVGVGEDPVAVLIVVRVLNAAENVNKIARFQSREEASCLPVQRFHSNLLADLDAVSRKRHALNAIDVVQEFKTLL